MYTLHQIINFANLLENHIDNTNYPHTNLPQSSIYIAVGQQLEDYGYYYHLLTKDNLSPITKYIIEYIKSQSPVVITPQPPIVLNDSNNKEGYGFINEKHIE